MAGPRFGKRRWRRPERLTLEHGPLVRRKDLGVSEPLPLESVLARKVSRRQIEIFLLSFVVLCVLQGLAVGLLLDHPLIGSAAGFALAVLYFFIAREFGDGWIVKALGATPSDGPRVTRLAGAEARSAGIPTPRVLNAPGDAPNAVAFGLRRRYVVTTQATESLDELALEGMVAHEIVHLRDGDATVASLFCVLAGGPDLLFKGAGITAAFALPLWPVSLLLRLARPIAGGYEREHRADIAAAMLTRYPPGVVAALEAAGGPSSGLGLIDSFWFVARNGASSNAAKRAELVAEM